MKIFLNIESSLTWESWEQYCVWKLISAQSVPIENYISILPKLDTKGTLSRVDFSYSIKSSLLTNHYKSIIFLSTEQRTQKQCQAYCLICKKSQNLLRICFNN